MEEQVYAHADPIQLQCPLSHSTHTHTQQCTEILNELISDHSSCLSLLSPFTTDGMFYQILRTCPEQKCTGLTVGANMSPWILAHALECTPELLALGLILAWVGVT